MPSSPPTQGPYTAGPYPYAGTSPQGPHAGGPAAPPYQAPPGLTVPGAPVQPPYSSQPGLGMGVPQGPVGAPPAYGAAPTPAPKKSSAGRWALAFTAALVVLTLIGAGLALVVRDSTGSRDVATTGLPQDPTSRGVPDEQSRRPDAPDATSETDIQGAETGEVADVIAAAVADVIAYWQVTMPEVYSRDYEPLRGGVYSASSDEGAPPCAESYEQIADNAYYCPEADVIVFDDEGLIPRLMESYGDLAVAVVVAHEWGHAVQDRVQMRGRTVTLEQQADCFAGAWVATVAEGSSEYFTAERTGPRFRGRRFPRAGRPAGHSGHRSARPRLGLRPHQRLPERFQRRVRGRAPSTATTTSNSSSCPSPPMRISSGAGMPPTATSWS